MRSRFALVLALLVLLTGACSDDDATATTDTTGPSPGAELSAEAREWCTFSSVEDATRFDRIFEEGRLAGLNMDVVNATASGRRAEYEAQGLSANEAIARVSSELFDLPDFVEACQLAFDFHNR